MRLADGDQGRQVRPLPRVQRAIRSATNTRELETPEPSAERRGARRDRARTAASRWSLKRGRFGQFLACTGYPECKTTRKIIATKQGVSGRQARPDPRREVPEVRLEPGRQAGPVRRVHRLHAAIRSASTSSRSPRASSARRTAATSSSGSRGAGKVFFGCANYPDCDFTLWNRPIARAVPEVRRAVPGREDHQAARAPAALQQRGVRLRAQ